MKANADRANLTEALGRVLERLCAPDLTLAEASELRQRLAGLHSAVEATRAVATAARPRLGPSQAVA